MFRLGALKRIFEQIVFGGSPLPSLLTILNLSLQILYLLAKRVAFFAPNAMFYGLDEQEVRPFFGQGKLEVARVRNQCVFRHSARKRPLNAAMKALSVGLPAVRSPA